MRHLSLCLILLATAAIGCTPNGSPTTRPAGMADRQEQALKDPMNYSPYADPKVSGGGTGDFDKEGFRRDLDHVLNP